MLTKLAWYKLQEPADSYREMFKAAALRFTICSAAVEAAQEDPDMDISETVDRVIATYSNTPKLDPKIRSFLASQMETWLKVLPDLPKIFSNPALLQCCYTAYFARLEAGMTGIKHVWGFLGST